MPDTVFRSHAVLTNDEGLKIPPTANARVLTIKIGSEQTPGLRM